MTARTGFGISDVGQVDDRKAGRGSEPDELSATRRPHTTAAAGRSAARPAAVLGEHHPQPTSGCRSHLIRHSLVGPQPVQRPDRVDIRTRGRQLFGMAGNSGVPAHRETDAPPVDVEQTGDLSAAVRSGAVVLPTAIVRALLPERSGS